MENSAVYSRIDDLIAKADEIKLSVDEFGEMLEDVRSLAQETNVTVTDIYLGTTYGEWITDLKDSGKSSSTYADASRMLSLIKYPQAVSDASVCCYLMQWAIDNNKLGILAQTAGGSATSGEDWSSLTSVPQVFGNEDAFAALMSNAGTIRAIFPGEYQYEKTVYYNSEIIQTVPWDYAPTTEPGIRNSPSALTAMRETSSTTHGDFYGSGTTLRAGETKTFNGNDDMFLFNLVFSTKPSSVTITDLPSGATITQGVDFTLSAGTVTFNRMISSSTRITIKAGTSSCRVTGACHGLELV